MGVEWTLYIHDQTAYLNKGFATPALIMTEKETNIPTITVTQNYEGHLTPFSKCYVLFLFFFR